MQTANTEGLTTNRVRAAKMRYLMEYDFAIAGINATPIWRAQNNATSSSRTVPAFIPLPKAMILPRPARSLSRTANAAAASMTIMIWGTYPCRTVCPLANIRTKQTMYICVARLCALKSDQAWPSLKTPLLMQALLQPRKGRATATVEQVPCARVVDVRNIVLRHDDLVRHAGALHECRDAGVHPHVLRLQLHQKRSPEYEREGRDMERIGDDRGGVLNVAEELLHRRGDDLRPRTFGLAPLGNIQATETMFPCHRLSSRVHRRLVEPVGKDVRLTLGHMHGHVGPFIAAYEEDGVDYGEDLFTNFRGEAAREIGLADGHMVKSAYRGQYVLIGEKVVEAVAGAGRIRDALLTLGKAQIIRRVSAGELGVPDLVAAHHERVVPHGRSRHLRRSQGLPQAQAGPSKVAEDHFPAMALAVVDEPGRDAFGSHRRRKIPIRFLDRRAFVVQNVALVAKRSDCLSQGISLQHRAVVQRGLECKGSNPHIITFLMFWMLIYRGRPLRGRRACSS